MINKDEKEIFLTEAYFKESSLVKKCIGFFYDMRSYYENNNINSEEGMQKLLGDMELFLKDELNVSEIILTVSDDYNFSVISSMSPDWENIQKKIKENAESRDIEELILINKEKTITINDAKDGYKFVKKDNHKFIINIGLKFLEKFTDKEMTAAFIYEIGKCMDVAVVSMRDRILGMKFRKRIRSAVFWHNVFVKATIMIAIIASKKQNSGPTNSQGYDNSITLLDRVSDVSFLMYLFNNFTVSPEIFKVKEKDIEKYITKKYKEDKSLKIQKTNIVWSIFTKILHNLLYIPKKLVNIVLLEPWLKRNAVIISKTMMGKAVNSYKIPMKQDQFCNFFISTYGLSVEYSSVIQKVSSLKAKIRHQKRPEIEKLIMSNGFFKRRILITEAMVESFKELQGGHDYMDYNKIKNILNSLIVIKSKTEGLSKEEIAALDLQISLLKNQIKEIENDPTYAKFAKSLGRFSKWNRSDQFDVKRVTTMEDMFDLIEKKTNDSKPLKEDEIKFTDKQLKVSEDITQTIIKENAIA